MSHFFEPLEAIRSAAARRLVQVLCVAAVSGYVGLSAPDKPIDTQTMAMFDRTRGRSVPVLLYGHELGHSKPLALISHGYSSRNSEYAFLAQRLVERGYVVASVQHELEGDTPMPSSGEPLVVRRPFWERGMANLLFVADQLRAGGIANQGGKVLLVGHSNGGDTSMLLASEHPEVVSAVFSLDHRRMPVPRRSNPRVCSARSIDQSADANVLPDEAEQARLGMVMVQVPVAHNDMWDGATADQKRAILSVLERCLSQQRPRMDS